MRVKNHVLQTHSHRYPVFAQLQVLPEIKRVKGIASAKILGSRQYAMRVWLNPDRMRAYNVSTNEVMEAIDISVKTNESIDVHSDFKQPPLMDWAR